MSEEDLADRDASDFRKPRFFSCGDGLCGAEDCRKCRPELVYEWEQDESGSEAFIQRELVTEVSVEQLLMLQGRLYFS